MSDAHLLSISGHTLAVLNARVDSYIRTLADHDAHFDLADMCYTAGARRDHHRYRTAIVGISREDFLAQLKNLSHTLGGSAAEPITASLEQPRLAFLLPGKATLDAEPLLALLCSEAAFLETFTRCENAFAATGGKPLIPTLLNGGHWPTSDRKHREWLAFAVEFAMTELWREWGIEPHMIVATGVGKQAAAAFRSQCSPEDALAAIDAQQATAESPDSTPYRPSALSNKYAADAGTTLVANDDDNGMRLADRKYDIVLEIGLPPTTPLVTAATPDTGDISSHSPEAPDRPVRMRLLQTLGRLYVAGVEPNWDTLYGAGARCISLPRHTWQHRTFAVQTSSKAKQACHTVTPNGANVSVPTMTGIAGWFVEIAASILRLAPSELSLDRTLAQHGLDSLMAVELKGLVERDTGIALGLDRIAGDAILSDLAAELAGKAAGPTVRDVAVGVAGLVGLHVGGGVVAGSGVSVVHDAASRFESFPLNEIQRAYWVGRLGGLELGGVSTHFYVEVDGAELDVGRFSSAISRLVARHDMLRAVIDLDGRQRVLESVTDYEVRLLDLRELSEDAAKGELESVRSQMSHQVLPADQWPLFDIRVSRLAGIDRLHLSFDMLVADAASLLLLGRELAGLYDDPGMELPELALHFRDYVLAEQALEETPEVEPAWKYWRARLASIPPAPELPLACSPAELGTPRFRRLTSELGSETWARLKARALEEGLTPSTLVCAAYAEVLAHWSRSPRFTLNLTNYRRLPLHDHVHQIVGDFTSLTLLEVDTTIGTNFLERARHLQEQLWKDLEHRAVNGVSVLREIARQRGISAASMPVVFTSVLNHTATDQQFPLDQFGKQVFAISQTPQVWLDNQVMEINGALQLSWDIVDGLFPPRQADNMFDTYTRLLSQLNTQPHTWTQHKPIQTPSHQLKRRQAINATDVPKPSGLLHDPFQQQAYKHPDRTAVVSSQRTLSYGEVRSRAAAIGHELRDMGAAPNRLVAIVMEKGWEQVVAALAVLESSAAYLPIDPDLPAHRLHYLIKDADVDIALTQSSVDERVQWPAGVKRIAVDQRDADPHDDRRSPPVTQRPSDLAYVIFTSGSTGQPKGVMIEHFGALNTIIDINRRFSVGPHDKVLALSSLSFDLSVYDLFGTLAAGGTIIIPSADRLRDPAHWNDLLVGGVSIWNSVPALMKLLVEHVELRAGKLADSLRLVMLSGDWIPVALPDRLRALGRKIEVMSLGGATEASIWSIYFPIGAVRDDWEKHSVRAPSRQPNLSRPRRLA